MDTLDRLLIREFIKYFIAVTFGLALLFLGIDFLSKYWKFNLPLLTVLEIYLYRIPEAIQQFLPVSSLMSVLLVLSSMSKDNEILALYSCGIGSLRISSTFIALIAIVCTLSFLAFDYLVPSLHKKQIILKSGLQASQEHALISMRTGLWYRSDRLIYNVGRFDPVTNTLEDVTVYKLTPSFRLKESIHAKHAKWDGKGWILQEGNQTRFASPNAFPESNTFETLVGIIPEDPSTFKTIDFNERTMRLRDLRQYITRNKSFGLDTVSQQVHYHERLALVFAPLIFVLLGIPFAMKPLRTLSMAKSLSLCFSVVIFYLLMFRVSLSIGKGGHIPPVVSAWAPNIALLSFAFWMIKKEN